MGFLNFIVDHFLIENGLKDNDDADGPPSDVKVYAKFTEI